MRIDWDKVKPSRWLEWASPVTLGFALLSLVALGLDALTGGRSTRLLFSVYRSGMGDPLFYPRLFLHVLGHGSFAHYAANMGLFLVLGPLMEKRYGAGRYLAYIAITALVTGLVHILISSNTAMLGASGVVFMLILLSAVSGRSSDKVPVTLVLVALIYLGREIVGGLFTHDSVSQLAHIAGGVCGIVLGLLGPKPTGE
ncbi:MAG: rhomboid family intramembrane serine protease [Clostridiales bacterium]|nr:rhomboid family intramembrane serine protease [Clostridiales bacterium]